VKSDSAGIFPLNATAKESSMSKGQQKSNREVRKPKSKTTKPPAAQAPPFTNPRNVMKPIGSKKTAK
jgi:hypothetical protein